LIRALTLLRKEKRDKLIQAGQRVACITFTNVAKDEILERTEHDALFEVSTIHDFLWSAVKPYQVELKAALICLNERLGPKSKRYCKPEELAAALAATNVTYSDRGTKFLEGRIFHDDLLGVAHIMFDRHASLARLVGARFPYIFVDEYQDTNPKVISILLNDFTKNAPSTVIGFFGDKMQSIYSDGTGEIPADLRSSLKEFKKEENYRCSIAVIALLNRIRTDIQQSPAGDNQSGSAVYINAPSVADDDVPGFALRVVREKFGWPTANTPKVLFLTHRLIAKKAGYAELLAAFSARGDFSKERFQSGEDPTAVFLMKEADQLVKAWRGGEQAEAISLLGKHDRKLAGKDRKLVIAKALDTLVQLIDSNAPISEVLKHARANGLLQLLDELEHYLLLKNSAATAQDDESQDDDRAFYSTLFQVPFKQVSVYHQVQSDSLPFSTKHGVKGAEYEDVVVVLDDEGANWNSYAFTKYLTQTETNEARRIRTRNLFYVSCSRAKRNLAVLHRGDIGTHRTNLETLFGPGNCFI
jgi:DNA helicase-2/ATP-dependent DNA helicase PcrA